MRHFLEHFGDPFRTLFGAPFATLFGAFWGPVRKRFKIMLKNISEEPFVRVSIHETDFLGCASEEPFGRVSIRETDFLGRASERLFVMFLFAKQIF